MKRIDLATSRGLFWLLAACGAGLVWLAPHPPMIDLPQHAGQLALLKQMLSGDAPWAHLLQLDPFTPYYIGFGLALPLTYLMPVAAALKLMLSLAYLAFVGMCVLLRRHFRADPRVDWLFLAPFFGFAFQWGFFTFLVASSLGLCLVWLADRHAQSPTLARGTGVSLLATALLFSHGLMFLFAMALSAALMLTRGPGLATRLRALAALVLPTVALLLYFAARSQSEPAFGMPVTVPAVQWQQGIRHEIFAYALGLQWRPLYGLAGLAMLAAPWLMGLRPRLATGSRAWVPFAGVAAVLLLVPSFVFETSFVYQRFALFLYPAYAWLFAAPERSTPATPASMRSAALSGPVLVGAVAALLASNGSRIWQFGRESADFDAVSAQLLPRQRALALIHDRASPAADNASVYVHYAVWYQAEHGGLVDFNFATPPPQVLRYRVATRPPLGLGFAWRPSSFDWQLHRGQDYRYFFVRHDGQAPASLFAGAPCRPVLLAAQGRWQVYERRDCAMGPKPGS